MRIAHHQLCLEPHDAIAERTKLAISLRVSAPPLAVIAPIHLNDAPRRRCEEVNDEAVDGHLPLERNTKLCASECPPEKFLGRRGRMQHAARTSDEHGRASRVTVGETTDVKPPARDGEPGAANSPHGACQRPVAIRAPALRWRATCASREAWLNVACRT